MKTLLNLFLLFFIITPASAQENDTLPGSWLISARSHFGFVIAHRSSVTHLQQKHVQGFEIELAKPLNGDDDWQQPYGLPLYSIAYQYFDLGAKSELGGGHAIIPRVIYPLNRSHWLRTSISAGVGIGYIEKIFDRYENYKNTAIGSHINAVVSFSYITRIKLNSTMQAQAGISFTHFSNGTIHPPNLGINIPTLNAGFSCYIGKPLIRTIYKPAPVKKSWFNKICLGVGIKGLETDLGINYYGISTLNYARVKIISPKSRLSLGIDGSYDRTLINKLATYENNPVSSSAAYRMGVNFGYELSAGRITMLMRNGFYIINQYKESGIYYIKIGTEYALSPKLLAGFYLKTHYGKADYFEYAIGYKFH